MKQCPFCAEEIQSDAVKCKHCKEWLENEAGQQPSNTPAQDRASVSFANSKRNGHNNRKSGYDHDHRVIIDSENWFENEMFAHKGKTYPISEIIALRSHQYEQTINFVTSHGAGFEVTLSNGQVLKYKARSVFIKTKKVDYSSRAFNFLSNITFNQRMWPYLQQIRDKGFFRYRDYLIYGNGDIIYKAKRLNIAEAGLQNGVEFGRRAKFGFNSIYSPDLIDVYERVPDNLFPQRICIKTKENRDVIYAILSKLADLKNAK